MKRKGLLIILCLLACTPAFSQRNAKYRPRTLDQLIELNRAGTDKSFSKVKLEETSSYIGIDPMYSMVQLQFKGDSRPISASHTRLLAWWTKLQNADKKALKPYENEFLFVEGAKEYWIPVPNQLIGDINSKYKKDETISALLFYVGANKEQNEAQFTTLFVLTGYKP